MSETNGSISTVDDSEPDIERQREVLGFLQREYRRLLDLAEACKAELNRLPARTHMSQEEEKSC